MKKITLWVTLLLAVCISAMAQQPYTQPSPLYNVNAQYVNGVAPGYWVTPGSGLTVNVSGGTSFCSGTVVQYAPGTLSLTTSTTNYVYLNTASSCAPAVKTTTFVAADIPIAEVTTNSTTVSAITDVRSEFAYNPSAGGSVTGPQYKIGVFNGAASGGNYALGAGGIYTDSTGNNLIVPGQFIGKQLDGGIFSAYYAGGAGNTINDAAFNSATSATILIGPGDTLSGNALDAYTAWNQPTGPTQRSILDNRDGYYWFDSINPANWHGYYQTAYTFGCSFSQTPMNGYSAGGSGCENINYATDVPGQALGFNGQPANYFSTAVLSLGGNIFTAGINHTSIRETLNDYSAGDIQFHDRIFNNYYGGGGDHPADEGNHYLREVDTIGPAEFTGTIGSVTPYHASGYTLLQLSSNSGTLGVKRFLMDKTQSVADTILSIANNVDGNQDAAITMTNTNYLVSSKTTVAASVVPPNNNYETKTLEAVTLNTTVDLNTAQPITATGPQVGFITTGSSECATVQSYGTFNAGTNQQVVNLKISDDHFAGDVVYVGGEACHAMTIDGDIIANGVKSEFYVWGSTANNVLIVGRQSQGLHDALNVRTAPVHIYPAAFVLDVRPISGTGDDNYIKVEESAAGWAAGDVVESGIMATSENTSFYYAMNDNSPYSQGETYWWYMTGNQVGNGRDFMYLQNLGSSAGGWLFHWNGVAGGGFRFDNGLHAPFFSTDTCGYTLAVTISTALLNNCAGSTNWHNAGVDTGSSFPAGWSINGYTQINQTGGQMIVSFGPHGTYFAQNVTNGTLPTGGVSNSGVVFNQDSSNLNYGFVVNGNSASTNYAAAYINGAMKVNGTLTMGGSNAIVSYAITLPSAISCLLGTDSLGDIGCNTNAISSSSFTGSSFAVGGQTGGVVGSMGNNGQQLAIGASCAGGATGGSCGVLNLTASWFMHLTSGTGGITLNGNGNGVTVSDFLSLGGVVQNMHYAVVSLPTGQPAGSTTFVSDATAYTPGSAPTGGGSVYAPVFYTGTGWMMY